MKRILFVCHGNICRSPMAEFVMKDMIGSRSDIYVESAATSAEEIGNGVHYGTRNLLAKKGISVSGKTARQITKADYQRFDYIVGMDSYNIRNLLRFFPDDPEKKICKLLDFTDRCGADIADPWYTGNFEETYRDVYEGCSEMLRWMDENEND